MKIFLNFLIFNILFFGFTTCSTAQKGVEIVADETQRKIDVLYDGKLFTSYIYPAELEKPVLYPIYTAKGTVITRGFPLNPRRNERVDHPHQVGLWFNHGDINHIDFWNNSYAIPASRKPEYGSVRHQKIVSTQNGPTQGILVVEANWVDYTGAILLNEETTFKFGGSGDWRTIERITKFTARQDTVTFNDNKEGLIGMRMDRVFEEPIDDVVNFVVDDAGTINRVRANNEGVNGLYRNKEGLETEKEVWGKPSQWVSLSAIKNNEKITVVIIDHKDNWGYPAHSMARGYGLFAANNLGARVFASPDVAAETPLFVKTLYSGESVTFRHLIVIKDNGFATDEEINKISADFNR